MGFFIVIDDVEIGSEIHRVSPHPRRASSLKYLVRSGAVPFSFRRRVRDEVTEDINPFARSDRIFSANVCGRIPLASRFS
jgi:hypothetical protein